MSASQRADAAESSIAICLEDEAGINAGATPAQSSPRDQADLSFPCLTALRIRYAYTRKGAPIGVVTAGSRYMLGATAPYALVVPTWVLVGRPSEVHLP